MPRTQDAVHKRTRAGPPTHPAIPPDVVAASTCVLVGLGKPRCQLYYSGYPALEKSLVVLPKRHAQVAPQYLLLTRQPPTNLVGAQVSGKLGVCV